MRSGIPGRRDHSYLSYLRDRLSVARDLLTSTGSVFVQIGDENVHLVRSLLDEVFGADNFVNLITFKKTSGAGSPSGGTEVLAAVSDYLLWYAKDRSEVKYRPLFREKEIGGAASSAYTYVEETNGTRRRATDDELRTGRADGRFFRYDQLTSQSGVDEDALPSRTRGRDLQTGQRRLEDERDGHGAAHWRNGSRLSVGPAFVATSMTFLPFRTRTSGTTRPRQVTATRSTSSRPTRRSSSAAF